MAKLFEVAGWRPFKPRNYGFCFAIHLNNGKGVCFVMAAVYLE